MFRLVPIWNAFKCYGLIICSMKRSPIVNSFRSIHFNLRGNEILNGIVFLSKKALQTVNFDTNFIKIGGKLSKL